MKNTFDFNRFGQLLADDLRVNGRKYAIFLGSLLGVLAFIIIWQALLMQNYVGQFAELIDFDPSWSIEITIFWVCLFICGCAVSSKLCDTLGTKVQRISRLTLPATQSEKFLSRWVIMVPGFVLAYIFGFEIIDLLRVFAVHLRYPESTVNMPIWGHVFTGYDGNADGFFVGAGVFLFLQSVYALGASIWPGKAFLRTSAWGIAYNFIMSIWGTLLMVVFIVRPAVKSGYTFLGPVWEFSPLWVAVPMLIGAVINYVVAYYRTKELEVVDRW